MPYPCRTCGREISANAAVCPGCGEPDAGKQAFEHARHAREFAARLAQPDAALAAIVGATPRPRSEITKALWDYIKANGLQDKKRRTMINADDRLLQLFNGRNTVTMFEMTKFVSGHLS